MKIHVEQGINCDDIEITIKCSTLDNNIEKIISLLSTPI
ncbi:LytR family transcriptional regulator [Clostridioides difficile]|nr:LytR family transcriptional regulator [Clostridioides difficile]VIG61940.1 LytR family transcriptional regulator [Clostridioides difficile]VIH07408.1 LytR family transcriptional regulator [Clostridioides difficile]VIH12318.1 LytR family transcriptional regulator [Clostridioides difficile]VIH62732.1 LytR family transcriptional regulator [Clostridioides difficile]